MATYLQFVANSRIVGPTVHGSITRDRYNGTAGATGTWSRGQLVKLSSGALVRVLDPASAALVDITEVPFNGKLFLALATVTTGVATAMAVQRILSTTIFEGPLLSQSDSVMPTAPESIIGTAYALWQGTDGSFAVDKSNTSDPIVEIVDVESRFRPFYNAALYKDTNGARPNFVRFKFIAAGAVASTGISDA